MRGTVYHMHNHAHDGLSGTIGTCISPCSPGPDTDLHDMHGYRMAAFQQLCKKCHICVIALVHGLLSLAKPHPLAVLACA